MSMKDDICVDEERKMKNEISKLNLTKSAERKKVSNQNTRLCKRKQTTLSEIKLHLHAFVLVCRLKFRNRNRNGKL